MLTKQVVLSICIAVAASLCTDGWAFGSSQVSGGARMTMTSYSEGTGEEQYSGSVSSIGLGLSYEYFASPKYSFVASTSLPVLGVSDSSVLSVGGAVYFYFMGLGTTGEFLGEDGAISFSPGFRIFAAPQINVSYLVYTTPNAKKSDIFFDVGATGGAVYSFGQKFAAKAYAGFGRGVGIVTSSINICFGAELIYSF